MEELQRILWRLRRDTRRQLRGQTTFQQIRDSEDLHDRLDALVEQVVFEQERKH